MAGLCWDARDLSNQALPCLEGFLVNVCSKRHTGSSFLSFSWLTYVLLEQQVMHQLILAVPICILLCQAPSITIFYKEHIPPGDYKLVGRVPWGEIRKSQMPYPRAHLKNNIALRIRCHSPTVVRIV